GHRGAGEREAVAEAALDVVGAALVLPAVEDVHVVLPVEVAPVGRLHLGGGLAARAAWLVDRAGLAADRGVPAVVGDVGLPVVDRRRVGAEVARAGEEAV